MVWVKRLLPIIIIAAAWFIYQALEQKRMAEVQSSNEKLALVTAKLWLATTEFNDDTAGFLKFRDSLLKSENISADQAIDLIGKWQNEPEKLVPLAELIQKYVDSLLEPDGTEMPIDSIY